MSTKEKELLPSLKLGDTLVPEQLIASALDIRMTAINKYDEIIWKVRAGYLAILYTALTFLMGKADVRNLEDLAGNYAVSLSIFFLILGFSLSAFSVDYGYVRKKLRVIVIRDMLVDIFYDPECEFKGELRRLLHVAAERSLKKHFHDAELDYQQKLRWNFLWILLPIYATTPVLAVIIFGVYKIFFK